jgi:two-component system, response regulator YesN
MITLIADSRVCALRSSLCTAGQHNEFLDTAEDFFSHRLDVTLKNCALNIIVIECYISDNKGLELLRFVKRRRPDVPVLFVCSSDSDHTVAEALGYGARDCFKKPVPVRIFLERIKVLQTIKSRPQEQRVPLKAMATLQPVPDPVTTAVPETILRALQFIDYNLADRTITTKRLAKKAGMSLYHFCRTFKHCTTKSPMQYVSFMRVQKAKVLLKENSGSMNIGQIAIAVGFYDASIFDKHFKRVTGLTPSAYRHSVYPSDQIVGQLENIHPLISLIRSNIVEAWNSKNIPRNLNERATSLLTEPSSEKPAQRSNQADLLPHTQPTVLRNPEQ